MHTWKHADSCSYKGSRKLRADCNQTMHKHTHTAKCRSLRSRAAPYRSVPVAFVPGSDAARASAREEFASMLQGVTPPPVPAPTRASINTWFACTPIAVTITHSTQVEDPQYTQHPLLSSAAHVQASMQTQTSPRRNTVSIAPTHPVGSRTASDGHTTRGGRGSPTLHDCGKRTEHRSSLPHRGWTTAHNTGAWA